MERLFSFFKAIFVIGGAFFLIIGLSLFSPIIGISVSGMLIVLGLICTFWPSRKIWIYNRFVSTSLVFVSIIGMVGAFGLQLAQDQKALQDLKISDSKKYLAIVKPKIPDEQYLEELKSLDPVGYAEELKIRTEQENAKIEETKLRKQKRISEMRAQIPAIKSSGIKEQLAFFSELADLDPTSSQFLQEKEKLSSQLKVLEEKESKAREIAARALRAKTNPEEFLEISKFSWSLGGFGTVMTATFTLKNSSSLDIKDFTIECTHSAPSGTKIDRNSKTIYEIIKANSARTISKVNMGFIHSQAASSSCRVITARAITF